MAGVPYRISDQGDSQLSRAVATYDLQHVCGGTRPACEAAADRFAAG